jgi:hypothetical protein
MVTRGREVQISPWTLPGMRQSYREGHVDAGVSVATTVIIASTHRDPAALWVPKRPVRHKTPGRIARSAALVVGSTPSTRPKVPRASDTLRISRQTPSVFTTPPGWPALSSRATGRRIGRMRTRNGAWGSVPART